MAMTDVAKNLLADYAYRNTPAGVGTLYVSLHTGDPGITGASESGLGRVVLGAGAPAAGLCSNASLIRWTGPSPASTAYTHFGLWDAASGGNFRLGKTLTATINTGSGGPVEIAIGGLTLSVDLA